MKLKDADRERRINLEMIHFAVQIVRMLGILGPDAEDGFDAAMGRLALPDAAHATFGVALTNFSATLRLLADQCDIEAMESA